MERITGVGYRDDNCLVACSTGQFKVRGQLKRIYVSPRQTTWKEVEVRSLERFRANSRDYEKKVVDPFGGRIKIERVCKDGWMMVPETGFGESGVFVPWWQKWEYREVCSLV